MIDESTDKRHSTKLLNYLQDSFNGYKEVAELVADHHLKMFFNTLAEKRKQMIGELKQIANITSSDESATKGTVLGQLHRLFVNLKSLIASGNADAIINEVKRGENTTIEAYKEVIREISNEDLRALFKDQLFKIEDDIIQIDTLSLATKS